MSSMIFYRCCNPCGIGSVIPKWQNVTKARPAGDIGGTHYTADPYPRNDEVQYNIDHPGSGCDTLPAGTCGAWLVGGDLSGLSAQVIQDTVNDIMSCAAADSTHATNDHNCYLKSGTVDMRQKKLFGGQWVLARKFWQGTFPWTSNDACAQDPNIAADQTHYRTLTAGSISYSDVRTNTSSITDERYMQVGGAKTVNAHSGITTSSWSTAQQNWTNASGTRTKIADILNGFDAARGGRAAGTDLDAADWDVHCANVVLPAVGLGAPSALDVIVTDWNTTAAGSGGIIPPLPDITNPNSYSGSTSYTQTYDDGSTLHETISVAWSRSGTVYSWNYSHKLWYTRTDDIPPLAIAAETHFSGSLTLSDAYNSADCLADFLAAEAAWDMSNVNLASFRTDELLAFAPLCVYDEVGPISPLGFVPHTMNDYSGTLQTDCNGNAPGSTASTSGQHDDYGRPPSDPDFSGAVDYIETWPQLTWVDPLNYVWEYPNGSYSRPAGFTGGATLLSPMRTGAIISHTQAGSERHFWFNYFKQQREATMVGGGSAWEWFGDTHGDFSQSPLPPVTMRWMDNEEAQYDGEAYRNGADPHPGNFPQAFLNQRGGVLRGAKFICATQKWPSVNFGRPCGPDKYAIDQPSVCCVVEGSISGGTQLSLQVTPTGNAINPLAAGGLAVNDYVALDDGTYGGIYKISSIGGSSAPWTIYMTTLAPLDGLPTGFQFGEYSGTHLGRLRWPSKPGICGRAAITTSYAAGIVTITPALAQPYLRKDPATGAISVDIYDASMSLLASGLTLTRVNDSTFTATHAAMATAAYMTGHGVDWTQYDASSKKTGVHLTWAFDQRKAAIGYTSPPTWYAGIPGCLSCTAGNCPYGGGACPAMVGIVPFYEGTPVESYSASSFFDFPSFAFDDIFGAHWQSAVLLTMPDPFWQQPFKPDCDITAPDSVDWKEDDGSGQEDFEEVTESGTIYHRFYPHHPLVEALTTIPSGMSLPTGVTILYDLAHNVIAPPFYPNGIPIADSGGNYASIETDWGFTLLACADIGSAGRFSTFYASFVTC